MLVLMNNVAVKRNVALYIVFVWTHFQFPWVYIYLGMKLLGHVTC